MKRGGFYGRRLCACAVGSGVLLTTLCRLAATAMVTAPAVLATPAIVAAPLITTPRKPMTHEKVRASACVKRYVEKNHAFISLINRCSRTLYVSVLEHSALQPEKRCVVFGLQNYGYGKAYGPGDWYVQASLKVFDSSARALRHCAKSGYATSGEGAGTFIQVVPGEGPPAG